MAKKIIFTRPDGGLSVLHPAAGERLAHGITLKDGSTMKSETPIQVDRLMRRWPVDGAQANWAESEEEFVARVGAKDVPKDATNVQIVDEEVIPKDRTFRDAWRHCPVNGCRVDMEAARVIHRQRLRTLRSGKLAALDVEYMRADETGDESKKREIAIKKKALRDVTAHPSIDAAQTPEELKNVVPKEVA